MRGTKEGTQEEINFVKLLNKKENLFYWDILGLNSKTHYAVRVITQKYGFINESKIFPKADVFIVKGDIDMDYLKNNDYFLDENDIQKFNVSYIDKSGISIKLKDSKKYQIMKLSPSTFKKLFGSNILASGASIYSTKEMEFYKNIDILNGWEIKEKEFIDFFNTKLNINLKSVTKDKNLLSIIKKFSNQEIKQVIEEDEKLSKFIFFGIGNFKEPFTAYWLYEEGVLKHNYIIPFNITTGSGRSKGIYTIVIKPRK